MVEGAYTNSVFNAPLAPVYMIEANKRYLASFTSLLKFASTEGNAGIRNWMGRAVNTGHPPWIDPTILVLEISKIFHRSASLFPEDLEQYDCTDRMERNDFQGESHVSGCQAARNRST